MGRQDRLNYLAIYVRETQSWRVYRVMHLNPGVRYVGKYAQQDKVATLVYKRKIKGINK